MENATIKELIDELTFTLPALNRKMCSVNNRLIMDTDINKSHVSLLFTLSRAENMTMTALGNAIGISKPNVTTIVDKLVTLGFTERITDAKDRRLVYIRLTKDGKIFVERCRTNLKNALKKTLLNYDDKEAKLLLESVNNLKILSEKFENI